MRAFHGTALRGLLCRGAIAFRAGTGSRRAMPLACLGVGALVAACTNTTRTAAPPRPTAAMGAVRADPYRQPPQSTPAPRVATETSPRVASEGGALPKGGGAYKLGQPYRIGLRWYTPAEDPNYDRVGQASWYGPEFHGRKTANGETYDMHALTAAHPTLPLPSYAYVTSTKTGRTVLVRINDRGPYAHDRIMDLSRRTAEALGIAAAGESEVRVRSAGRAPLSGDDAHERQFLAGQPWAQGLAQGQTQSRAPAGYSAGPLPARRMGLFHD